MRRLRSMAGIGLAAGALSLIPAPALTQDAPTRATVLGVVRDSSGASIAGAEVAVSGTNVRVNTDAKGEFRLTNVPAGTLILAVRRLGYAPASASILVADVGASVSVVLRPLAQALATVVVRGDRRFEDHGRLSGFYQRRSRSSGGHFITREQIDQRNPSQLTDLLRQIPGARVLANRFTNAVRFRNMRCAPLVWLDGFPATAGEFDIDVLDPYIVEGIEIYSGVATVPPEFRWVRGGGSCGAIVIWTGFEERRRKNRKAAQATMELEKELVERVLFTADQVDIAARADSGAIRPAYPDSLFRHNVTGQVLVEFVVDTSGAVVLESISSISSTHAEFTEAVRRALREARFSPARISGRPVRQLVQLPVRFEIPAVAKQQERG